MSVNKEQSKFDKTLENFIFAVILVNSVIIYLQVSGYESMWMNILDTTCTVIFILEMIYKLKQLSWRGYWSDGWNRLDGTLVILSLPSIAVFFFPVEGANLSVLLALRLLRALRFFRFLHFLKEDALAKLGKGFLKGLTSSWPVLAAFFVIIVIFGLINCSLFKDVAPDYFGSPLSSIYSVFQLFTIEGWYDIPSACCGGNPSPYVLGCIRLYFCLLLIAGGIIGMSFINSVFVDAMAEDNNDEVIKELKDLHKKIDELSRKLEEK